MISVCLPHSIAIFSERSELQLHAIDAVDTVNEQNQYEYECDLDIA
jgi:hypothetical protein